MAVYRNIQLSFWTDSKVEDEFTPEDKYFYLYLLTNPQTNICGCYEFSYSQVSRQTGYNRETINRLLERFENEHGIIRYSKETKEILILHWYKYNWSKSKKVLSGVCNVASYIKNKSFKNYIFETVEKLKNDTLCIGYTYPMDTSDTVYINNNITNSINNNKNNNQENKVYINIINYLNTKCNTKYKYNTPNTIKHINARIRDGYTEQDFFTVIDKKADEWIGTEQEKYLRPDTLFGSKFESYLNQRVTKKTQIDEWGAFLDDKE